MFCKSLSILDKVKSVPATLLVNVDKLEEFLSKLAKFVLIDWSVLLSRQIPQIPNAIMMRRTIPRVILKIFWPFRLLFDPSDISKSPLTDLFCFLRVKVMTITANIITIRIKIKIVMYINNPFIQYFEKMKVLKHRWNLSEPNCVRTVKQKCRFQSALSE